MRIISFILLTIFSMSTLVAKGTSPELPNDYCKKYGPCTGKISEIWQDYLKGTALDEESLPAVFTGRCFARDEVDLYTNSIYAIFLIEKIDGALYFNGGFAYMYDKNPYEGYTVEQAQAEFVGADGHTPFSQLHATSTGATIGFNTESSSPVYYWLRNSSQTGRLVLISLFGKEQIFCNLNR